MLFSFLDCRYLVPADLTVGQFVYVVRKRIKLGAEKAIFVFVKNTLPPTGEQQPLFIELYYIHHQIASFNSSSPSYSCHNVCSLRGKQGRRRISLHDLQRREHLWIALTATRFSCKQNLNSVHPLFMSLRMDVLSQQRFNSIGIKRFNIINIVLELYTCI